MYCAHTLYGSNFTQLGLVTAFPVPFVEETPLGLVCVLGVPVETRLTCS